MPASAAIEFLLRDSARLDGQRRDTGQPVFPVRRRQVVRRIHPLDRVAKHPAVAAQRPNRADHETEGAALPVLGEGRFRLFMFNRTEAVEAAEVVHTVHHRIIRIFGPESKLGRTICLIHC